MRQAQSLSSYSDRADGCGFSPLRLRMSNKIVFAWLPSAKGSCRPMSSLEDCNIRYMAAYKDSMRMCRSDFLV